MSKGGSSNSAQINFQKEQAAQGRQKEAERSARLKSGSDFITSLFDGTPQGAKKLDLSSLEGASPLDPAAINTGNPLVDLVYSKAPGKHTSLSLADSFSVKATPDNGNGGGFGVYDGNDSLVSFGKTLDELSKQNIMYGGDTSARTGGFDQPFYDKFRKANLDYYMPELDRQFANAKSDLTYGLARAGTLQSSVAGDKLADLTYSGELNRAQLTAKADTAAADLRSSVAANKSAAINQLYATEDPSLAATTATAAVRNVELTQPTLDPIGQLFSPIAIGIGSALQGYNNQRNYAGLSAGNPGASAGRNVTT